MKKILNFKRDFFVLMQVSINFQFILNLRIYFKPRLINFKYYNKLLNSSRVNGVHFIPGR